jgi:hypothetical protein
VRVIYEVTNQTELEAALAKAKDSDIVVCRGSGHFALSGSAQVTASGSAQVTAYGSAQVTASDSAQVRAYGSAQVTASGSAQVRAYGSAQVTAYGSAQVTAYGSAQVRAYGSAQVTAYGSAQVRASKFVAVTVPPRQNVKVEGGVLIAVQLPETAAEWCEFYGVPIEDGIAVLYKGLDDQYCSPHGMFYTPGTTPFAPDWDATIECGGGLHFSPTPAHTYEFVNEAKRFVACPVRVDEIVVHKNAEYPQKVKAPRVALPCYEVDVHGNRVEHAAQAVSA